MDVSAYPGAPQGCIKTQVAEPNVNVLRVCRGCSQIEMLKRGVKMVGFVLQSAQTVLIRMLGFVWAEFRN